MPVRMVSTATHRSPSLSVSLCRQDLDLPDQDSQERELQPQKDLTTLLLPSWGFTRLLCTYGGLASSPGGIAT